MKRKSPLNVDRVLFRALPTFASSGTAETNISGLTFDGRRDFLIEDLCRGIGVKLEISNRRIDRGTRRKMSFRLIDLTTRSVTACSRRKIVLDKDDYTDIFVSFPPYFEPNRDYRMVALDETAEEVIAEEVLHIFDATTMGHPAKWYEVIDGGIRPAWSKDLFRSLCTEDGYDYYVRFNISHRLGYNLNIMPEVEVRLHYPDGVTREIYFREPQCRDMESYKMNRRWVEIPFITISNINGVFYAELLCMGHPIGGFVFSTTWPDQKGSWYAGNIEPLGEYDPETAVRTLMERMDVAEITLPLDECFEEPETEDNFDKLLEDFIRTQTDEDSDTDEETSDEATAESPVEDDGEEPLFAALDKLTGIRAVKDRLSTYERMMLFNKMRSDKGLPLATTPLHAMFLGSPGTGKTTVAKLMGDMLRRTGVLSRGHVVVKERATLLGQNYNSESEKTLAAIEEARGGILFIDEAYQLYQPDDPRDPGKFVIETLLTALSDTSRRDWALVLAGYPDEMRRMFEMNPGFKSRIPDSNIYLFEDFTGDELLEIAERYLADLHYTLSVDAHSALKARLMRDHACKDKSFGNARHVLNLIQTEILLAMAVRVTGNPDADEKSLTEIQASDIPGITDPISTTLRPRIGFVA